MSSDEQHFSANSCHLASFLHALGLQCGHFVSRLLLNPLEKSGTSQELLNPSKLELRTLECLASSMMVGQLINPTPRIFPKFSRGKPPAQPCFGFCSKKIAAGIRSYNFQPSSQSDGLDSQVCCPLPK